MLGWAWASSLLNKTPQPTGAIDVIAIKHFDGTINCSPFHVQIGKSHKKGDRRFVSLVVNGRDANLSMKVGPAGEAFFLEKTRDLCISLPQTPLPELEKIEPGSEPKEVSINPPIPLTEILSKMSLSNASRVSGRERSFSDGFILSSESFRGVPATSRESIASLPDSTITCGVDASITQIAPLQMRRDRSLSEMSHKDDSASKPAIDFSAKPFNTSTAPETSWIWRWGNLPVQRSNSPVLCPPSPSDGKILKENVHSLPEMRALPPSLSNGLLESSMVINKEEELLMAPGKDSSRSRDAGSHASGGGGGGGNNNNEANEFRQTDEFEGHDRWGGLVLESKSEAQIAEIDSSTLREGEAAASVSEPSPVFPAPRSSASTIGATEQLETHHSEVESHQLSKDVIYSVEKLDAIDTDENFEDFRSALKPGDRERERDENDDDVSLADIAPEDISPEPAAGDFYESDTDSYLSLDDNDPSSSGGQTRRELRRMRRYRFRKVLTPNSDQLVCADLALGANELKFILVDPKDSSPLVSADMKPSSSPTAVKAQLFVWDDESRVVAVDLQVLFQKIPGTTWASFLGGSNGTKELRPDAAKFLNDIAGSGYEILYFGNSEDMSLPASLPAGPVLFSPEALVKTNTNNKDLDARSYIFKAAALRGLKSLFPSTYSPFHAAFVSRECDLVAFERNRFPEGRIFLVGGKGEMRLLNRISPLFTWSSIHGMLSEIFPFVSKSEPICYTNCTLPDTSVLSKHGARSSSTTLIDNRAAADEAYSDFNFWRLPPPALDDV